MSQANQTYKRNYVLKVKASIIYKLQETEKVGVGGRGRREEADVVTCNFWQGTNST